MKKYLAALLLFALVVGILAGCGTTSASSVSVSMSDAESDIVSAEEEAAPVPEAPALHEEGSAAEPETSAEEPEQEEPQELTGAVIPAEECAEKGYDVAHGMYDFETYVELPLTDGGETLSYWTMIQPFMMGYSDFDISTTTFFREMAARTGVGMDVIAISMFSAGEQFALMVSSGDYSDLIESAGANYSGGVSSLLEQEVLVDLMDYVDIMPNYTAWLDHMDCWSDAQTLDGQMGEAVSFTSTELNVGPQIRGDWLDALGLELPVTYDDYHDMLSAFKDAYGATLWLDPNGSLRYCALCSGYDIIFNQSMAADPIRVIDGVVEYCPVTDDYRAYLQMMNQWWSEGLIYPDFLAQSNISTPDTSLVANGTISTWAADSGTMTTYDDLSDEIDVRAAAFPRREPGQQLHLCMPVADISGGTSISTSCADLELAAKWLDYLYTYEGALLTGYGIEGEGLTFDTDGNPMYTDLVLNNPDMITVACSLVYSKFGGAGIIDCYRFVPGYTDKQRDAIALWSENRDTDYHFTPGIQYTTDESARYAALLSDIETYAKQTSLQFMTGELSIDQDWDAYVAQITAMDLDELLTICQGAYDRYMAR